ncbi:hypothetical protein ALQ18_200074 [Pseudomonas marginalis pv. marginalis]|nr:hypothetical protein ALQ18_200074 [Pseudomonas marginalis pv. marginalis]
MLGLFQQVAVEVVDVSRALAVKAGFLLDQAIGVVLQPINFADFVFNVCQQQPHVVVAVFDLGAIGVNAAADQVQAVAVFVAGNVAQFIPLGGDFSVGVVAVFPRCAAG